MENKITIIGGSGFIGSYLCNAFERINQNFEIIDLNSSKQFPEKTKIGDIRNLQSLRETISGDIVINLAAIHRDNHSDKTQYYTTNVYGTQNLVKVCEEKGIKKIIFTSSVAVYGFAKPFTDEFGLIKPFNEYGLTKYKAETVLQKWQLRTKKSLIIVRPTVIFGANNRGNVYNLMKQIVLGNFIMVGSGQNKKSMAYVENLVDFLISCTFCNKKYVLLNYVDTPDLTMNDLVKIIKNKSSKKNYFNIKIPYWLGLCIGYTADFLSFILKKELPISSIRIKKFCTSTQFSSNKSSLEGFTAKHDLKSALEKTLEYEFFLKKNNE